MPKKNAAAATLTNKTIDGASNTLRVRLDTTDVVNNLPVNRLNGGADAGPTTFWRGDGQWISPPGGGDVTGPDGAVAGEIATYANSTGKLLGRTPLTGMVIGDTAAGSHPASAIIIPSFAAHPDRIFGGTPSTLDDHFEGIALDAKWTHSVDSLLVWDTFIVSDSRLSLGAWNNADTSLRFHTVQASIPNANDFTITLQMSVLLTSKQGSASSVGSFRFILAHQATNTGAMMHLNAGQSGSLNPYYTFSIGAGVNFATSVFTNYCMPFPRYFRFKFINSTRTVEPFYSFDGHVFQQYSTVGGATTGFNTNLPNNIRMVVASAEHAQAFAQMDWIKFTNP